MLTLFRISHYVPSLPMFISVCSLAPVYKIITSNLRISGLYRKIDSWKSGSDWDDDNN